MKQTRALLLSVIFFALVGLVCVQTSAVAFSVYESFPITSHDIFESGITSPALTTQTDALDSQWQLRNRAITYEGAAIGYSSFTFGNTAWTDCVVKTTLSMVHGREAGILLHYQDNRNYYSCIIDAVHNTVSLVRVHNGVEDILDQVAIAGGKTHEVYVDFYKDEIAVFVDNESALLVTDAVITSGMVGFFTRDARVVTFSAPNVECRTNKPSVLGHLTDIVSTNADSIEFPVLMDKVRVGEIGLKALNVPEGAVFEYGSFNWTPREDQLGDFDLSFEAVSNDGAEREKKSITVTVFAGGAVVSPESDAYAEEKRTQKVTSVQRSEEVERPARQVVREEPRKEEPRREVEKTPPSSTETVAQTSIGNVDYSGLTSAAIIHGGSSPLVSRSASNPQGSPRGVEGDEYQELEAPEAEGDDVPPAMTTFTNVGAVDLDGTVELSWADRASSGATIYLVEESLEDAEFSDPEEYWVSETTLTTTVVENGTYYYRVSAYTAQYGLGSELSPYVEISAFPERSLDVLETMVQTGVFDHMPSASTSSRELLLDEADTLDNYAIKLNYDVREQGFTGLFFIDPEQDEHDISELKTIHYRVKTDVVENGPVRVVLELKYDGQVVGSVLVNEITDEYTEHSFPVYCNGGLIDEVVLVVSRDSDPDQLGAIYFDEIFFVENEFIPTLSPEVPDAVAPGMSDEALLTMLESDMAHYFYRESIGPGYVRDTNKTAHASIAATGFGLSALTILAHNYEDSDVNWNQVTPDDARSRAYQILSSLVYVQETLQDGLEAQYGKAGCFYHFIDAEGRRIGTSEVSTVDTAILVMGALTAGEYFGGDVKELADRLFDNIDWTFFLNRMSDTFYMGWKPERSFGFSLYKEGGFLSDATYNVYTDEIFMISLAAIGRHPLDEDVRNSFYAFERTAAVYEVQHGAHEGEALDIVNSYYGSLFTYVYAHCFIDFESLGEDKPANGSDPINWWINSYNAIVAGKDFCEDRSEYFPFSFDDGNSWGLSACEMPSGRYEGLYGGVPTANGPHHDGTVATTMPICALPFYKADEIDGLSDNEGFQAVRYYYEHHKDNLYGEYGFYGSYDDRGRFSTTFVGIDVGSALLMIENYRSRLIWNTMLQSERLNVAFDSIFNNSFNYVSAEVCVVGSDENADEVSFGDNLPLDSGVVSALHYIQIDYNVKDENSRVEIYTDNKNNELFPYSGDGDAAGLIGNVVTSERIPLYWVVFDEKPTEAYVFDDLAHVGFVQDVSMTGFDLEDAGNERTVVRYNGSLSAYPIADRTVEDTTMYVCLGADFSQASQQRYSSESITIDVVTLS